MEIVHLCRFIILPGRTAETGTPVVGRHIALLTLAPDIVIPVRIVFVLTALHKPLMFIGSMVHHQIHDNAKSPGMCLLQHLIKVLHGAELFHNRSVITDIIPIVIIGRLIDRRKPDHINPQIFQIVQSLRDPCNITDAVPVAVHKTAGINLIHYRFFPPCFFHYLLHPFSLSVRLL